jgi:hypothetical protein
VAVRPYACARACCLFSLAGAIFAAETADSVYREGRKAERAGEMARAYLLYSQAAALDPGRKVYWLKSQAVRSRAALQAKAVPTPGAPEPDAAEAASDPPEPFTASEIEEARKPQPPPQLRGDGELKDFDLRGDAKALYEQVARAFGLDTVFDGEFQPGTPLRFQMGRAGFRETLQALGLATGNFIVPLSERLFLVAKDTQQKRQEIEPVISLIVPLPETVTVQEAQEMAQAVRQVMQFAKFHVDAVRRVVIIRDTAAKAMPAVEVLEDLMSRRPAVEIELQFMEVGRSELLSYGLRLPTRFPAVSLSTILNNLPTAPEGLGRLIRFGGGQAAFGVGIADAAIVAELNRSRASNLLRVDLRSLDGQPATFHVGDRYPILTSGYFGPITGPGEVFQPPPSFNFEDLGVAFKVTPKIHDGEEVTLEVEAEFKVLGSESFNGIPTISNRKVTSRARLRSGEWGVIAGMMSASEARSFSGLAGLAALPGIGPLVRKNERNRGESEVIVVLKPVILGLPANEFRTRSLRTGSDTKPLPRF